MLRLLAVAAVIAVAVRFIFLVKARTSSPKVEPATATDSADSVVTASGDHAMGAAQRRAVAAVVLSILVFIGLAYMSAAMPHLAGLPLAAAPGLAVSAGLLLFAALPPTTMTRGNGGLVPRNTPSFNMRRTFAAPVAVAVVFVAFLVATGLTSSQDELGRYRELSASDFSTMAVSSPYPGWYYGLPLIAVTAVLVTSVYLALRRVAATSALGDPLLAHQDRKWREITTRVLVRLGTGTLLGYLGGTALITGLSAATLSTAFDVEGHGYQQSLHSTGITVTVIGAAMALLGVVLLVLAADRALTIRSAVARVPGAESGPAGAA